MDPALVLNENQREAGCLGGHGGPVPGGHPCSHPYEEQAILAGLALGTRFSPSLEGWAGQARGGGGGVQLEGL